jgi:putative PIN family toxin of toxin-antitoxin system
VSSPPLLAELRRVLAYPKLANAIPNGSRLAELFEAAAVVVFPSDAFAVVSDESDNRVLEAAAKGGADCIVSGDEDLLSLGSFHGIIIERPGDFLARMDSG